MENMQEQQQCLIVEPRRVHFVGNFDYDIERYLTLHNADEEAHKLFKVKTTMPINILVDPITAIIPPKSSIMVQLIVKPIDFDGYRTTRKLMIKSATVDVDLIGQDCANLWEHIKSEEITSTKVKCILQKIPPTRCDKAKQRLAVLGSGFTSINTQKIVCDLKNAALRLLLEPLKHIDYNPYVAMLIVFIAGAIGYLIGKML